jgi:hypothetical protein
LSASSSTDALEIFFDADSASRKVTNLRHSPAVALLIGGSTPGDERTVQYEGVADEPTGTELQQLKELYFQVFPDGRQRETWPGITYVRVPADLDSLRRLQQDPPQTVEFHEPALGKLR